MDIKPVLKPDLSSNSRVWGSGEGGYQDLHFILEEIAQH